MTLFGYQSTNYIFIGKRRGVQVASTLTRTFISQYMPLPSVEYTEVLPRSRSKSLRIRKFYASFSSLRTNYISTQMKIKQPLPLLTLMKYANLTKKMGDHR